MITNKQIERALRFAKPVLDAYFDTQKAQDILDKMKSNYQELGPEVPNLKSSTNQMLLKIAVDTLAIYRALLSEMPQPEALELNIFLQQSVGANDDINRALFQPSHDLLLGFTAAHPAQDPKLNWNRLKPLFKRFVMLLSQNRCRD